MEEVEEEEDRQEEERAGEEGTGPVRLQGVHWLRTNLRRRKAGRRTKWWRRWRAPVVLHVLVTAAEQAPSGCRVSSPVADCMLPHLGFWM